MPAGCAIKESRSSSLRFSGAASGDCFGHAAVGCDIIDTTLSIALLWKFVRKQRIDKAHILFGASCGIAFVFFVW